MCAECIFEVFRCSVHKYYVIKWYIGLWLLEYTTRNFVYSFPESEANIFHLELVSSQYSIVESHHSYVSVRLEPIL